MRVCFTYFNHLSEDGNVLHVLKNSRMSLIFTTSLAPSHKKLQTKESANRFCPHFWRPSRLLWKIVSSAESTSWTSQLCWSEPDIETQHGSAHTAAKVAYATSERRPLWLLRSSQHKPTAKPRQDCRTFARSSNPATWREGGVVQLHNEAPQGSTETFFWHRAAIAQAAGTLFTLLHAPTCVCEHCVQGCANESQQTMLCQWH